MPTEPQTALSKRDRDQTPRCSRLWSEATAVQARRSGLPPRRRRNPRNPRTRHARRRPPPKRKHDETETANRPNRGPRLRDDGVRRAAQAQVRHAPRARGRRGGAVRRRRGALRRRLPPRRRVRLRRVVLARAARLRRGAAGAAAAGDASIELASASSSTKAFVYESDWGAEGDWSLVCELNPKRAWRCKRRRARCFFSCATRGAWRPQ